jgi:hypothetical protein
LVSRIQLLADVDGAVVATGKAFDGYAGRAKGHEQQCKLSDVEVPFACDQRN